MYEDTRKRLDALLWRERAKKVAIGLAIIATIGLVFEFENLGLAVTNAQVHGTVVQIDPLVAKNNNGDGETLEVKLDSGQLVRVLALKSRNLSVGDNIEVVEHHHATGRVTHSLK